MRSRSVLIFSARDDQPEVGSHGLVQGKKVDGELVDLQFNRIDARLIAKHFLGRAAVFLRDRADTALDRRFHQRTHFQQLGLELV